MPGGRKIVVALAGGTAVVSLSYIVFLLGEHSPDWLGPTFFLVALFTIGACIALSMDAGE